MATTFDLIQSYTLPSNMTSVTLNSIPSTYTDLTIFCMVATVSGSEAYRMQFNGDTTSGLYSSLYSQNTSSSGLDYGRYANNNDIRGIGRVGPLGSTTVFEIMQYANTSRVKQVIALGGYGLGNTMISQGTWRNTAAINSITISNNGAYTMLAGSTINIYGIKAA